MSTTTTDVHAHGGHDEHGEHNPYHQHHFTTMEQQFDTSKIGMWLFLATEVLLFGGLFVGFGMMQARYPREFVEAHEHLVRWQGALNTVVLLVSSFTMVMAVQSAKNNKKDKTVVFLALTILCACIFLVVKYFEYAHKFEEGWLPGRFYSYKEDAIPGSHGYATFFAFYFMMTGLHGFHILAGIVVLMWFCSAPRKANFRAPTTHRSIWWDCTGTWLT